MMRAVNGQLSARATKGSFPWTGKKKSFVRAMLIMLSSCLMFRSSFALSSKVVIREAHGAKSNKVTSYFALPEVPKLALEAMGCSIAAPVQVATWAKSDWGEGAARGESVCIHAPTGSGKTLAMMMPALFETFWKGRDKGAMLMLAPSRELVTQHAALAKRLGVDVTVATTSTVGSENGLENLCEDLRTARCVIATPRELCTALEEEPRLYVTFASRVESLVLDELDLLIPARKPKVGSVQVSRWQDKKTHPAEALVKLVAKRTAENLQVLAGSATLDKIAKLRLDKCLKSPKTPLRESMRVVTIVEKSDSLTTKTKREGSTTPTVRTTLIPSCITHSYVKLPKSATNEDVASLLGNAIELRRPKACLVFVCTSYGLKVRAINTALRGMGYQSSVLGDILWPSSARNRRRAAHKRVRKGKSDNREDARPPPESGPAPITNEASSKLNDMLKQATFEKPQLVVADEAVTRGLHLDNLDTVFILGKPANADTYLHLAGRTARDPFRGDTTKRPVEGNVISLVKHKDHALLEDWLLKLGGSQLVRLDVDGAHGPFPDDDEEYDDDETSSIGDDDDEIVATK